MKSDLTLTLRISNLFDSIFPIASLLIGSGMVGQINNNALFFIFLIVIILNSAATIWNDIEDREIDVDNGRKDLLGLNFKFIKRLKIYIYVLIFTSLVLALLVNSLVFILVIVTIFTIFVYNSKPIQASRRPVMSIIVLSGAGSFLPYLLGVSLGINITLNILLVGLFWWLGRISLSVLKDFKDARGDARHNKKTFLLYYGSSKVAILSIVSLSIGYGGFALLNYLYGRPLWGLLVILLAIVFLVVLRIGLFDPKATYTRLDFLFRKIAIYQLLLDFGIILWLTF